MPKAKGAAHSLIWIFLADFCATSATAGLSWMYVCMYACNVVAADLVGTGMKHVLSLCAKPYGCNISETAAMQTWCHCINTTLSWQCDQVTVLHGAGQDHSGHACGIWARSVHIGSLIRSGSASARSSHKDADLWSVEPGAPLLWSQARGTKVPV